MTYQISELDDGWEMKNDKGEIVGSGEYPLRVPNDIIDAILEDMGVGNPQREALRVLFKKDWEFSDRETESEQPL